MKTETRSQIYTYILKNWQTTVKILSDTFKISSQIIHRHLLKLQTQDLIYKEGKPPKVYYYAKGDVELILESIWDICHFTLSYEWKVITTTTHQMKASFFAAYAQSYREKIIEKSSHTLRELYHSGTRIRPNKLYNTFAQEYIMWDIHLKKKFTLYLEEHFTNEIVEHAWERFFGVFLTLLQYTSPEWFYDATNKLISLDSDYKECDERMWIDTLTYTWIDKIDAHKTHAYDTMEQIKEFQDESLITAFYTQRFWKQFKQLIKRLDIDSILVIPNNVTRKISFNAYIQERLQKELPKLTYISTLTNSFPGRKPQKKVTGMCKRMENADKLFQIDPSLFPNKNIHNVLVIDDVVGSGATMNMVIKKLKKHLPDVTCHGFALLGSYRKWFDVVTGI